MEFTVAEYSEYNEAEILNLYNSVGWTNYTDNPKMLQNAYANSLKIYGAYVDEKLIGIIRAVGDGYSQVYIQDILILPEYHRNGIGTALLQKMLDTYKDAYQLDLMTDNTEKTVKFYKSMGFTDVSEYGCCAFIKK